MVNATPNLAIPDCKLLVYNIESTDFVPPFVFLESCGVFNCALFVLFLFCKVFSFPFTIRPRDFKVFKFNRLTRHIAICVRQQRCYFFGNHECVLV